MMSLQIKRLGDVCEYDKVQGVYSNLPYVGLEHIESNTARFIGSLENQSVKSSTFKFSNEHVLYGRLRPYLNKALAPNFNGHCSTEIFPIKPGPQLLREYLLYWLISDDTKERINSTSTGARMPRADMNEVLDFDIPVPPLPEQQRIVRILDEAFAAIAVARANAEKNLRNARELFESYLNEVFTRRGEGWIDRILDDVCLVIQDGAHESPKIQYSLPGPDRFLYITSKNIRNNFIDLSNVSYVDRDFHEQIYKRCTPSIGDILLTKDGANTGNVAINNIDQPFSLLSSVCLIKTDKKILIPSFLCFYLQSPVGLASIMNRMTGTAIKRIILQNIKTALIPLPDLDVQSRVVAKCGSLLSEIVSLELIYRSKSNMLDKLKQSLLHHAFTGQL